MTPIGWRATAIEDLERVLGIIGRRYPEAATGQLAQVETVIARLSAGRRSGRPGRLPGTRELAVPNTPLILVYAVAETAQIIRILHAAHAF